VTFHPHPRTVLGNRVELLSTLERRLELLTEAGAEDVLVVEFTPELALLDPAEFTRRYLQAIGAEVVVAGAGFRFGHGRSGALPHYGGTERRIEAFLLDWEGDLYGKRLVLELWQRLREERAFASEEGLIAQIARDVAQTRASERPV